MSKDNCVGVFLEERGVRRLWLAKQLNISPSYLTLLLQGKRRWTERLKCETERVLMFPREILFFEGGCRRPDDILTEVSITGQPEERSV